MNLFTQRSLALGIALAALVMLPLWFGQSYYIRICNEILYWSIFALALNVLVGYGGLVSLGYAQRSSVVEGDPKGSEGLAPDVLPELLFSHHADDSSCMPEESK